MGSSRTGIPRRSKRAVSWPLLALLAAVLVPSTTMAQLAESTVDLLSSVSLGRPAAEEPVDAIRDIDAQRTALDASPATIDTAVADLALLASEIHDRSLSRGLGYDLTAAFHAGRASLSTEPIAASATVFYNRALHRLIVKLEILFGRIASTFEVEGALRRYSLGWERSGQQPWEVAQYAIRPVAPDEQTLAATLESASPARGLPVTLSPRPEILPQTTPVQTRLVLVEFTDEGELLTGLVRLLDLPVD